MPEPGALRLLEASSFGEMASRNRASVYGLLNFFREYVPRFAETTEPLRKILGRDDTPWTEEAYKAVKQTAKLALGGTPWIAFMPEEVTRVKVRLDPVGVAVLLLQEDPANRGRKTTSAWLPVATWGRRLELGERELAPPLLELRTL